MSRKAGILVTVLSVIALCLSAASLAASSHGQTTAPQSAAEAADVQYVLYLGTNDKDTNAPVFPPEEARNRAEEILVDHFGGYTMQEARGGWVDDSGTLIQEYTLVIYLSDTTSEAVHTAADELMGVFNQGTVLIQANESRTEFYSGPNG
ncbi:MAG: DUF3574 domain-containing protein [Oscillibacter sp.]|nr:DUF3574 domain-containing protein [Oscillibacter sp.]